MNPEEKTALFLRELYRWNKKINLTSVDEKRAGEVLINPSLAMEEFFPAGRLNAIDVGSGGGIPGVVLAVRLPSCDFLFVESNGKKSAFLSHVSGLLGLENVRVVSERAEKLAASSVYRGWADVVTSRAVRPETVFSAARALLKPGGRAIIHRSQKETAPGGGFEPAGKNAHAVCYLFRS